MEDENKNRTRWLHLRLTKVEYELLNNQFDKSTCRKLSDYARRNLLRKPVILKYRNQSLDELMGELIMLRKDLNSIGNNFNQAVKKLHGLNQISEFRHWIIIYELEKKALFDSITDIKKNVENIAQKWLQS